MSRPLGILLVTCFFVSGATSLVLEVAWAKELSYVLGNSIHATATVIGAFMAGLALGSLLAGRRFFRRLPPLRVYALLQFGIAILGFFSIAILRSTEPVFEIVYRDLTNSPVLFLAARFALVFPMMALPATLMGMSLPLVVEARSEEGLQLGANAGSVYGINTLGAVTGTYAAGFLLIPELGLTRTCMLVGVADFAVGLVLLVLHHRRSGALPRHLESSPSAASRSAAAGDHQPARDRRRKQVFGAIFLLSGFLAMVYEVAWFRLLANVLGGTVHAFTSMLGVFLVGVGLGSVAGTRLLRFRSSALLPVAICLLMIGVCAASSLALANHLPIWYAKLFWALHGGQSVAGYVLAQAIVASLVVLPTTLVMGIAFPMALRAYESFGSAREDRKHTSEIYALNTLGGIAGSLFAGFLFLPRAGLTPSLMLAAIASCLLAVLVLFGLMSGRALKGRLIVAVAGVSLMGLTVASVPSMDHLELHRGVFFRIRPDRNMALVSPETGDQKLFYYREGMHGSVSVTGAADLSLRISGKPVAVSSFSDRMHLMLLGQLPVIFADRPERVAVVGLGMGVALGSLLSHPDVEAVDVIELEQAVVDAQKYFRAVNGEAPRDPRVTMIVEDARTHLTYSGKVYDVITSDPISPLIAGAGNLYSRDYYQIVAEHLTDGGVFAQWWQMGGVSESTYQNILATMREVFPHMLVFAYGSDSVVLASADPIEISWEELRRRAAQPDVKRELDFYLLESPLHLLNLLYADTELVDRYTRKHDKINTDDNVWLEHQMPLDHYSRSIDDRIPRRMATAVAFGRLQAAIRAVPGVPEEDLIRVAVRNPPTPNPSTHAYALQGIVEFAKKSGRASLVPEILVWHEARRRPGRHVVDFARLEDEYERARAEQDAPGEEAALEAMLHYPQLPLYHEAAIGLIDLLVAQGRNSEALEYVELLERRTPARPGVYALGAQISTALGLAQRAREFSETGRLYGLRSGGGEPEVDHVLARDHMLWGQQLSSHGLFDQAIKHFGRALEIEPTSSRAHNAWGSALFSQRRVEEALAHFQAALRLKPDHEMANLNSGTALDRLGRGEEAVAYLEKALRINSDSAEAHSKLGVVLASQGREAEAADHFREAIEIEPNHVQARINWGTMLRLQGDTQEAVSQFEEVLRIDSANAVVRRKLIEARNKLLHDKTRSPSP